MKFAILFFLLFNFGIASCEVLSDEFILYNNNIINLLRDFQFKTSESVVCQYTISDIKYKVLKNIFKFEDEMVVDLAGIGSSVIYGVTVDKYYTICIEGLKYTGFVEKNNTIHKIYNDESVVNVKLSFLNGIIKNKSHNGKTMQRY